MKKAIATLMLLIVGLMVVPVLAHAGEETAGAAGVYVLANESGASIWQESNGVDGLQTTANGDIAADTRLA